MGFKACSSARPLINTTPEARAPSTLHTTTAHHAALLLLVSRFLVHEPEILRKKRTKNTPKLLHAKAAVAMLVALALVVVVAATGASADDCNPVQLAECVPAITGGAAPSVACCTKLRAQQGCFCKYARDPTYEKYVNSPNAQHTLTVCGIAVPSC